ncbi:MAG: deoxyribose-phosphate aldolase [Verrucomicrobia bacterium]|nr:deoxyribose-phosphate aldolase [Verrucomicrobiota bacterium]
MTLTELAPHLELTLLRADATRTDVQKLCADARANQAGGVVVNGAHVIAARHFLDDTEIKVTATAGFPLGAVDADVKRYEVEVAVDHDAHELEVVPNHGWLKEGNTDSTRRELRDLVEAADERPLKVLLETSLLNREQWIAAARLAVEAEAKFVTLSAVFGTREVSPEVVRAVREAVGPKFGLKVFANVATLAAATALLDAGVDRLGVTLAPKVS